MPVSGHRAWSQRPSQQTPGAMAMVYGVGREERLRGLGLVCVPTHTRVCLCLVFHRSEERHLISTTTRSPPPHPFLPIAEPLGENLLCVTKKYAFSLCYRPWLAARPLSPEASSHVYDLHVIAID